MFKVCVQPQNELRDVVDKNTKLSMIVVMEKVFVRDYTHSRDANSGKQVVFEDSMNKLDRTINEIYSSVYQVLNGQDQELESCFNYVEKIGEFTQNYVYMSTLQVCVLIAIVVWQITNLRQFFIARKLV